MELESSLPLWQETPPVPILSQNNPVHAPHFTSWRFILILSINLRLGLPSGLFPSGFLTKILYATFLSPYMLHAPPFSFFARIIFFEYRLLSSSLCSFLHSPVTSFLLGPNILRSTQFSNTLSLHSSLDVSDQISHPYKTTEKIMVVYILMFICLDSKLEDTKFCTQW